MEQLFQVTRYTDIKQYTLNDTTLKSLLNNTQNSLMSAILTLITVYTNGITGVFYSFVDSARSLFFSLLAIYIFLAVLQAPLGCYILRTVRSEEELFIKLPNSVNREYQKNANAFVASIKVS